MQQPDVTDCNLTAPIAALGTLRNYRGLLFAPYCNCMQIFIPIRRHIGATPEKRFGPNSSSDCLPCFSHSDVLGEGTRKPAAPVTAICPYAKRRAFALSLNPTTVMRTACRQRSRIARRWWEDRRCPCLGRHIA